MLMKLLSIGVTVTILSNEEVVDGVSERGGHPVYRKP